MARPRYSVFGPSTCMNRRPFDEVLTLSGIMLALCQRYASDTVSLDDANNERIALMAIQFCLQRAVTELHLIDVENLLGTPWFTSHAVADLRRVYDTVSAASNPAHYLVGTSAAQNLLQAGLGWGQGQLVFSKGKDGAERAMLAEVTLATASRYDRVVIGSGDGIFADLAASLQSVGIAVRVVCRQRSLSKALRLAVQDARFLPERDFGAGAAA
jgi:hypothetical protein